MNATGIAALLALGSALCVAVADSIQQRATQQAADKSDSSLELFSMLFRNRRWRWGGVVLLVSIVLQAEALDQGSVLLVQVLLVLSLLFALPISATLSQGEVTARQWVWAVVLTAAVGVIVTVGDPQAGQSRASLHTWLAVVAVLGPLLIGCLAVARRRGGALAAVLLAFVSGTLWGVFAVPTKGVMAQLDHGVAAAVRAPELYAWLVVAAGGFAWEQLAFRAGALTASMPTLEVTQPVVGASLGMVVLGETLNTGPAGMAALAVAAVVMTVATVELARGGAPA
ncbi:MAG TPA: DMT family transporter [Mycobacterium sp.]